VAAMDQFLKGADRRRRRRAVRAGLIVLDGVAQKADAAVGEQKVGATRVSAAVAFAGPVVLVPCEWRIGRVDHRDGLRQPDEYAARAGPVRITNADPRSGASDLTFALTRENRVRGSVGDVGETHATVEVERAKGIMRIGDLRGYPSAPVT